MDKQMLFQSGGVDETSQPKKNIYIRIYTFNYIELPYLWKVSLYTEIGS